MPARAKSRPVYPPHKENPMGQDIPKKTLDVLEYPKIIEMLADFAQSQPGAKLCRALLPETEPEKVRSLLRETTAAKDLVRLKGSPSFASVKDIGPHLRRLSMGAPLSMGELLDIAHLLRGADALLRYRGDNDSLAPALSGYFEALTPNKHLEQRILSAILSEEQMSDHASPALYDLRRRIGRAEQRVKDVLSGLLRSPSYKKYLQDGLVTVKNGRYVVPVKSEFRSEVAGLVHETSASGATVFIEPMGVVEANNEIRVLKGKEQAEMERILAELSLEAGRFIEAIETDYRTMSALDAIFARARLSENLSAEPPIISEKGALHLKNARHPLLARGSAVPISISVGDDYDALIITGPNTGGKTVSLKTAGLLALMAQSGLHIPAEYGSELPVYGAVFADIGDEQSIEQSLSTFSAHMRNIVDVLGKVGPEQLVLFDELGAGTDPVEGAALAVAIIEHVRASGASLIATTHYPELKIYALETPGVENASCEFDVQSLRPTYRLLTGVPGRSNALAIASRLGMPESVINDARLRLSSESVKFERLIENIEKNRAAMEFESKKAGEYKREAAELRRKAQELYDSLERSKEKELERARTEAMRIVEGAKEESRRILSELEKLRREVDREDFRERLEKARADVSRAISGMEDAADPVRRTRDGYTLPRPLRVGDTVKIEGLSSQAVVTGLPDANGYVTVKAGIVNTKVHVGELRLVEKDVSAQAKGYVSRAGAPGGATAKSELDIRGMTSDEAGFAIDAFLDANVLAGLSTVTIIHGKGTGALRAAVRGHLRGHPQVRAFRPGTFGEGEDGVTVVELK